MSKYYDEYGNYEPLDLDETYKIIGSIETKIFQCIKDIDTKEPAQMIKDTLFVATEELNDFRRKVLEAKNHLPVALVFNSYDEDGFEPSLCSSILMDCKDRLSDKGIDRIYDNLEEIEEIIRKECFSDEF